MTPVFSVLIPVFDAESTLGVALESVRRQTEKSWECIVVDDGSRDTSAEIAARFSERDARFRLVRIAHCGIVAALNRGLEACSGRYVARLDADDVMRNNRLALQRALLETRPELAGAGCHVRIFPRAGMQPGLYAYESWLCSIDSAERVRADAFIEMPIAHPTLVLRREILQRFSYRDCGWPEDYDLVLRLLETGHDLGIVARKLVAWRDSAQRLSRVAPHCTLERITACKAQFLARSLLDRTDQYLLWGYGDTGRNLSRALRELGKRPAHIVELHPGRIGQRIAGARVIAPEELASVPRRPLIVSVAGAEPRRLIRAHLNQIGFVETRDYLCAA